MLGQNENSIEKEMNDHLGELVILVAEDEEFNRFYIQELFEGTTYKMIEAKNGEEAVEMAKTNDAIDLILMDIRMPRMNGTEAMQQIKTFNPKVPIVALTALAMEADRKQAMESGFDSFLTKPIDKKKLFEKIKHYTKTS